LKKHGRESQLVKKEQQQGPKRDTFSNSRRSQGIGSQSWARTTLKQRNAIGAQNVREAGGEAE